MYDIFSVANILICYQSIAQFADNIKEDTKNTTYKKSDHHQKKSASH